MTLKISNHFQNLQFLSELDPQAKKVTIDQVVTKHSAQRLKEVSDLQVGWSFHACKWADSIARGISATAATIGAIGLTGYALWQNKEAIGQLVTENAGTTGILGGFALGGTALTLYSEDGRDMLRFMAKGTLAGVVFAGWKLGQHTFQGYENRARLREAQIAKKLGSVVEDLTEVYRGIAGQLKQEFTSAKSNLHHLRSLKTKASKIQRVFDDVLGCYTKLGIAPEDSYKMTRSLQGLLEQISDYGLG